MENLKICRGKEGRYFDVKLTHLQIQTGIGRKEIVARIHSRRELHAFPLLRRIKPRYSLCRSYQVCLRWCCSSIYVGNSQKWPGRSWTTAWPGELLSRDRVLDVSFRADSDPERKFEDLPITARDKSVSVDASFVVRESISWGRANCMQ